MDKREYVEHVGGHVGNGIKHVGHGIKNAGNEINEVMPYKFSRKKHGILIKTFAIVFVIMLLKIAINYFGYATIEINSLITAFISGVFFTVSILFAGAAADYKESEKIPGEIAVLLKSLYNDSTIISVQPKDKKLVSDFQLHLKELLFTLNANFLKEGWKLKEIDMVMDKLNEDINNLGKAGVAPNFLLKFRADLTALDRLSHRIDVIIETSFIPAAYAIAETSIAILVIMLLFVKVDFFLSGALLIGVISLVLVGLLLLIKDMDDPFMFDEDSYANVDLSILFNLEKYWKETKIKT